MPKVTMFCQLWFENSTQPVLSLISQYMYIYRNGEEGSGIGNNPTDDLEPYLLTCPIPPGSPDRNPILVSVTENACDTATALLKITHNKLGEGDEKSYTHHTRPDLTHAGEQSKMLEALAVHTGATKI